MIFLLQQMLFFTMPLLVVAIGGLFSEKSGIVNIAMEGIMVFGGFIGILFLNILGGKIDGQFALILSLIIAMIGGGLFASLHAFASVSKNANQSISGMSLNILAPGIAIFVAKFITGSEMIPFTQKFFIEKVPVLNKIPFIGPFLFEKTYLTTYIAIMVFLLALFVINYTKFGLRLKAAGEHPQALEAAGGNVKKVRYAGVILSGVLGGLGGMIFFIPTSSEFVANVSGYGFLAIAVLVFSRWDIKRIIFTSIFFGLMLTIATTYNQLPIIKDLKFIPGELFKMLPYLTTLLVLTFSKGDSSSPKSLGVIYDGSAR